MSPGVVHLASGSTAIAVGDHHACAVSGSEREVFCWGDDRHGQLGDTQSGARALPVEIGLDNVVSLAAGAAHTCALKATGTVWCWGANSRGELGDGTLIARATPVTSQLANVDSIAAGGALTCATTPTATHCFGANNARQLVAAGPDSPTPVQVAAVPYSSLTVGDAHACGIEPASGALRCWGSNARGQIGNGGIGPSSGPEGPVGVFSTVAAGAEHTCGTRDGRTLCWGRGDQGELGNFNYVDNPAPQTPTVGNSVRLGAGRGFTCAMTLDVSPGDGMTYPFFQCFGRNARGEGGLGFANRVIVPMVGIGTLREATAMDGGDGFGCALNGGAVSCWGDNSFGQLGNGTFARSLVPVRVPLP
jgi:alpha-tubulin suppressor-like RCC1 family protein